MPEIVNCPKCERKLKVPDSLLGQSVKCPTCGETFGASTSAVRNSSTAPVDEEEPRSSRGREEPPSRRSSRALVRREANDDDDDDDDNDRPSRRRGRRGRSRRDLAPHRGSLIMVLGILSFFVAGPILGPIAWVMGNSDLREMREGRMDPEGEGQTNAGRICGMISTILSIVGLAIGLVFCLIYFICVVAMVGAAGAGSASPGPGGGGF